MHTGSVAADRPRQGITIRHLTVEQAKHVLNLLVSRDSIETRLDYMVGAIGSAHPEVVIDFLGARVRRERELKADSEGSHRYEAIPFRFHGSNEALKKVPDYMLKEMRRVMRTVLVSSYHLRISLSM